MDKKDFIEWARKLQLSYQSSGDVKSKLAKVDLLAIVGPTGVGKTTLINQLKIPSVLSDVTRDLRKGEKNNQNYHFREDYLDILKEIKSGEFAQFLVSDTDDFFTVLTQMHTLMRAGVVWQFLLPLYLIFRKLGFRKVVPIYIMPPGYVEWMRRISGGS